MGWQFLLPRFKEPDQEGNWTTEQVENGVLLWSAEEKQQGKIYNSTFICTNRGCNVNQYVMNLLNLPAC